jgi:hypothetical protein
MCYEWIYVKTYSIDVPFNLCGFDELLVFVNLDISIYVPFYLHVSIKK